MSSEYAPGLQNKTRTIYPATRAGAFAPKSALRFDLRFACLYIWTEGMKEQQREIGALKAQNEAQNEALKSREGAIEARLGALEHRPKPSRDHYNQ
jgi:cell division protein FtsB